MTTLFNQPLNVINVGIAMFSDDLKKQHVPVTPLDWTPPGQGNMQVVEALDQLAKKPLAEKIAAANQIALERIIQSHPVLVGYDQAINVVPGMTRTTILHAGPPVSWENMCGAMKGAVTGALVFEGLATDLEDAARLAASGEIAFSPCHEHDCVGSMAGVTSASMFMHIVENKTYGNRAFTNRAQMGGLRIRARPKAIKTHVIQAMPGSRIAELSGVFDGEFGVTKAVKQEQANGVIGSIDAIRGAAFINQGYDGSKIAGSEFGPCVIEGNYFEAPSFYGGAPHYDAFTIMGAYGGLAIRGNLIDMSLTNGGVGVNNAFQFAPYWPGALYDDIDVDGNIILHGNDRSFAIMKGSANASYNAAALWRGQIRFTGNWWRKAGGARKIFYAGNNFADVWSGNIDLATGAAI